MLWSIFLSNALKICVGGQVPSHAVLGVAAIHASGEGGRSAKVSGSHDTQSVREVNTPNETLERMHERTALRAAFGLGRPSFILRCHAPSRAPLSYVR